MTAHILTGIIADNGASGTGTEIRGWVQKCHDALATIGLVQTADTGQAVISTLTNPSSNSGTAGYEVWRFDDDLQATHPIVFKIEYGRGSTANSPAMWITVGKGSDGAGNITDVLVPRNSLVGARTVSGSQVSNPGTPAGTGYAAYNDCCLSFVPFADLTSGSNKPMFILERSRDDTGAPTGAGITLTVGASNAQLSTAAGAAGFCAVNYDSPGNIAWGAVPVVIPSSINGANLGPSTSLAAGTIGPVFPWIAYVPGTAPWQCLSAMTYSAGDAPSGVFQAYNLGHERTYLAIQISEGTCGFGASLSFNSSGVATLPNTRAGLAILWE